MDRFGTHALLVLAVANISNEQRRHCRIVNVRQKPKANHGGLLDGFKMPAFPEYPLLNPNTAAAEHLIPLPHGVCM